MNSSQKICRMKLTREEEGKGQLKKKEEEEEEDRST